MIKPDFTMGPWEVRDNIGIKGQYVFSGGKCVADTCKPRFAVDSCKANAKLIAAAPQLAEALNDMLAGWSYIRAVHGDLYGVGWDRAEDAARAALVAAGYAKEVKK